MRRRRERRDLPAQRSRRGRVRHGLAAKRRGERGRVAIPTKPSTTNSAVAHAPRGEGGRDDASRRPRGDDASRRCRTRARASPCAPRWIWWYDTSQNDTSLPENASGVTKKRLRRKSAVGPASRRAVRGARRDVVSRNLFSGTTRRANGRVACPYREVRREFGGAGLSGLTMLDAPSGDTTLLAPSPTRPNKYANFGCHVSSNRNASLVMTCHRRTKKKRARKKNASFFRVAMFVPLVIPEKTRAATGAFFCMHPGARGRTASRRELPLS